MKSILLIITRLAIVNAIFLVAILFFLAWQNKPVSLAQSTLVPDSKTEIPEVSNKPGVVNPGTIQTEQPKSVDPGVNREDSTAANDDSDRQEPTTPPEKKDLFAELGTHNSPSDCWIAYSGHLYNITSAFGSHPGGDASLAKYCGRDATGGFDTKDKSPASPHSQAARQMLTQYLIQ